MAEIWEFVESLIGDMVNVSEPSLALVVNIFVLAIAVVIAMGRLRAELRGMDWSRKSPEERRARIYEILHLLCPRC